MSTFAAPMPTASGRRGPTRAHAAQQAFSRQLMASQENERKRIAAELHDSLGQRLVIIKNLALILLNGSAADGAREQPVPERAHATGMPRGRRAGPIVCRPRASNASTGANPARVPVSSPSGRPSTTTQV